MNNANHPAKGATIKVEPIRSKKAIANIKAILAAKPRDLCLFTVGINTAYRANELLSLRIDQVKGLKAGDQLTVKQSKNHKYRTVTLNRTATAVVAAFLENDPRLREKTGGSPLFYSERRAALTVSTVSNQVKSWCAAVGLKGNYGSHTLRKTWGYWQYQRGVQIPLLMVAYGHASQQQTLDYLCIQHEDIQKIYDLEL